MDQESLFKEYEGVFDEEGDLGLTKEKGSPAPKKNNLFALPDAVGKKSAKEAWIEYFKSRLNGLEPEVLHAVVAGKVRDILLAEMAGAEELQMHPFVHKKAKWDFKNWQSHELQSFYEKLISIYHDARSGGGELDLATEKLLLSI